VYGFAYDDLMKIDQQTSSALTERAVLIGSSWSIVGVPVDAQLFRTFSN
jgi:hypothetical protein